MAYKQSIITEVRRKNSNGDFETPVVFGAEQKCIGSLLNSHNNNLEEQNILGPDCYTIIWEDEDNIQYTTKKFYNGDLSSIGEEGYYILFITYYEQSIVEKNFYFGSNTLFLPEYGVGKAKYGQDEDEKSLLADDPDIYSFNDDMQSFNIDPDYRVIKKESLCFRVDKLNTSDTKIDSDIVISEKITTQKADRDGKIHIKESIVNYL